MPNPAAEDQLSTAGAQEETVAQEQQGEMRHKLLREAVDFSLVSGGPLFQLFRKSHLTGDGLELLHRRIFLITLVAWLPLLVLAIFGSAGGLSFFRDVEVHTRFLVALSVLIAAELVVHLRMRLVVRRFVERRIILNEDLGRFHRAIDSAIRLRNSIPVECLLLVTVYILSLWMERPNCS
jgi:hypothetical protein